MRIATMIPPSREPMLEVGRRAAGVTMLLVDPAGPDPVATISELRSLL
jgi:hypothetical protein